MHKPRIMLFGVVAVMSAACTDPLDAALDEFAVSHTITLDRYQSEFAKRLAESLAAGEIEDHINDCPQLHKQLASEIERDLAGPPASLTSPFVERLGLADDMVLVDWRKSLGDADLRESGTGEGQVLWIAITRLLQVDETCFRCHGDGATQSTVAAIRAKYPKTESLGLQLGDPIGNLRLGAKPREALKSK